MVYELKDDEGKVIMELPNNLTVRESLYLRGTKVKEEDVPKHLLKKCIW